LITRDSSSLGSERLTYMRCQDHARERRPSRRHLGGEVAKALAWLWRGYDPAKTSEISGQGSAEKEKPFFRVKIYKS
jgi:hypothetical protein